MLKREFSLNPSRRMWAVIFALISLAVLAGGYWYLRTETKRIRREKFQDLAAIGELKAGQIAEWRKERLGDARNLAESPFFREKVEEWLGSPENLLLRQGILKRLELAREVYGYAGVLLLGQDNSILLCTREESEPVDNTTGRAVEKALSSGKAVLSDLYRSSSGRVYLESVVPVPGASGASLGVLVLRCDAQAFLFPLVQSWPMPRRSAETLLVRREGEEVLFLNDLRFKTDAAFSLRLPLTQADLPAVQAALGKKGIWEGKDYRGIKVLADLRPVPGSPWFMVVKVDASEILAGMRYRAVITTLIVVFLILLAAAATSLGYRKRQAQLLGTLYQSEREQREAQEELRTTLYSIGDAVITTDTKGLVKVMNPVAERLSGWSETEARGKPLAEVFHIINEETRGPVENPVQRVLREGVVVGLANHTVLMARDGREIPIADAGAPICEESGAITGVVLVFRDQTEERRLRRFMETRLTLVEYAAGHTLDELLTRALDEVGAFVGSPIGFYHFVESDQKTVSLQQWSTRTVKEFCRAEGKGMRYGIDQAGVWTDCVHQKKPVIHNDYASLPHKKGLPEGHVEVIRELVVPVIREDRVVAILGVGNKPTDYTEKDAEIISYLADMSWEIVRKKQAEEVLAREQYLMQALMDNIPDYIYFKDRESQFIRINKAHSQAFGLSDPVQALGKTDFDFFTEEHARQAYEDEQKIIQTGQPVRNIEEKETRTGRPDVWVLTTKMPLCDREGLIVGTFGISRDITERKRTEEALRESEARYHTLFEKTSNPILVIDSEGNYISGNEAALQFLECTQEELKCKNVRDTMPPGKDVEAVMKEHMSLWESGGRIETEYYVNNILKILDLTITPMVWHSKQMILGVGTDITERKRAEQALRESEEKYRILHEFAGEAIFTYSTDLKMMEINKAGCDYIGGAREEMLGKDIFDLGILHPDDISLAAENIRKILSREESLVVDKIRFKGKHGLYGTFQVTSTPVIRDGEIVAITNVCRDVTLEEQLYSALEASERRYKFLFSAGNDAVFVYGMMEDKKPGKFVEVNDLACTLTGYSREELLELSPLDLALPEEKEKVYESNRILSEKKHRVFERTLVTKDKHRIAS